ncbi:TPA: hypothetical protein L9366_005194, partial [Klebsiella pneumoniae]|nr:hypothetical protein [Klebsiella pneumoniae]
MVDEYHTGNPVPSSAIPDVWDNNATIDAFVNSKDLKVKTRTGIERDTMSGMQKKFDDQLIQQRVDFDVQHLSQSDTFNISQNEREETFSRQLSEQESIFESSQADKENRFASFLDSSGYVFLGEYQNGPFQFSARNQYIRYDNQYYRLNAATDVSFTTTGTDATSFANDVTHFVLMDGDTLRQNLGSSEPGMGAGISKLEQPGNVQNALREFYADAFPGIDPTGQTSSTQGILDAIAQINSQVDSTFNGDITTYPRLVFRGGVFLAAGLLVKSNIVIEGNDGTLFVPEAGTDASHVWITKGTEATTPSGGAKRLFRPVFRNIKIGYGFQNKFPVVVIAENVGGIKLEHSSYAI